jgi:two-component system, chemotaxis family, sensor kinase Cph1
MASIDLMAEIKKNVADLTNDQLTSADLSLSNCDREPIHIPSAIQSHGVLLTFTEADLVILQISQNSEVFLGQPPQALLGQKLSTLLTETQIDMIRDCLNTEFENSNPLRLEISIEKNTKLFEGVAHRTDGVIILELEYAIEQQAVSFFDFYKFVKIPVNHLQNTQTLAELSQAAVNTIRNITGFDRVMLYRFEPDGSGHVIAETKCEAAESFLGLHYPATDIPKQAKELYRINLLRIIPDASYTKVALEPALNPITGRPLDMSLSCLRSVSPLHTEYLGNMGVRASMSISLLCNHQLWGLISCHHEMPKRLSYETRTICEFLGQVISFELVSKADTEDLSYKMQLQIAHSRFANKLANCPTISDSLNQSPHHLLDLAGATGFAFCEDSKITCLGETPPPEAIQELLKWLDGHCLLPTGLRPVGDHRQIGKEAIYSTNMLITDYPQFVPYREVASGLLALRISYSQQTYFLWFRPEVIQTIDWGGNPHKPYSLDAQGQMELSPRKSFELWKETVQFKSLPWKTCEIEAVLELRSRIIGILLQKAEELSLLNQELERSNMELDSFAYVASHDLREPLRGIHNYATFLIEDFGDRLGEQGTQKLETLMRLTQRMEDLINSLLHYSQFGRAELLFQAVDLGEVVQGVLDLTEIGQLAPADFRIPRPLPIIQGDRTQITELFTNLINNAIKYNDRAQKWVEIGYILPEEAGQDLPQSLDLSQTVFFVRDNGIGIRTKHLETIFKIFKRLHPTTQYQGGTGAGLTISKKIVERHHGNIAVTSIFGEGSTFYFTIGEQP